MNLRVLACVALLPVWLPLQMAEAQAPQRLPGNQPAPPPQAGGALAPDWIPLHPDHEKYLNQILAFWEHTTSKVTRYRSAFKRWEYDARRKDQPKSYSEGVIKYSAPDKGLFKVEKFQELVPPKEPGGQPQWVVQEGGFREHWVCDGKSIFEFDYINKQIKQRPLPPEMQGQQIAEGPLPFLFGAKVERIKQRFWIRVITPKDTQHEYWLEAVPRTREDAVDFRKLIVILDEEDFLPKGMRLFHPGDAETTFAFENRETNWNILAQQLNPWLREFFEPATPKGWKMVVEQLPGNPPPAATPPRQALQPAKRR